MNDRQQRYRVEAREEALHSGNVVRTLRELLAASVPAGELRIQLNASPAGRAFTEQCGRLLSDDEIAEIRTVLDRAG
jgi:hypothetical protein